LVDVVEAEECEGEVPEDGHGVGSVFGPGLVVVFSPGGVSYVVGFVFYAPVSAYVGVYVCGAGPVGGCVGEDQGEFFADPYLVEVVDVAADAGDLRGVWEVDAVGVGGPGGPVFDSAVAAFGDEVAGFAGEQWQAPVP